MIKKVRIAVDHGNRNMKTCSQVFTTGLTIQDKKPARGEKFLFYEGKYYVLSENRIPYQRDKTQDDRFFILTLFAIVKELEENSQIQPEDVIQVDLPIGLPPKHYAELCERYEAYFKRQGKIHDINYCGMEAMFSLHEEERKLIYQHVFEERTFKEMSILNQMPEERCKGAYYWAIRKIRKRMGGKKS